MLVASLDPLLAFGWLVTGIGWMPGSHDSFCLVPGSLWRRGGLPTPRRPVHEVRILSGDVIGSLGLAKVNGPSRF